MILKDSKPRTYKTSKNTTELEFYVESKVISKLALEKTRHTAIHSIDWSLCNKMS